MVAERINLLISQWRDTPLEDVLKGILNVMDQNLENPVGEFPRFTAVDTAEGRWLDWIGERMGLDRPQRLRSGERFFGFGPERDSARPFDQAPFFTEDDRLLGYVGVSDDEYRPLVKARIVSMFGNGSLPDIRSAATHIYDRDLLVREGRLAVTVDGSHSVNDYSVVSDDTMRKVLGIPLGIMFINNEFLYRTSPLFYASSINIDTLLSPNDSNFDIDDANILNEDNTDRLWILFSFGGGEWYWVRYNDLYDSTTPPWQRITMSNRDIDIAEDGFHNMLVRATVAGNASLAVIPEINPEVTELYQGSVANSATFITLNTLIPDDGWLLVNTGQVDSTWKSADYLWLSVADLLSVDAAQPGDTPDSDNSLLSVRGGVNFNIGHDEGDGNVLLPDGGDDDDLFLPDNDMLFLPHPEDQHILVALAGSTTATGFTVLATEHPSVLFGDIVSVSAVQRYALADTGFALPAAAHRPWLVLHVTVGGGTREAENIWVRTTDIWGLNPLAVGDDVSTPLNLGNRLALRGGDDDLYVGRNSDGNLLLAYGKNVVSSDVHVRVGVIGA